MESVIAVSDDRVVGEGSDARAAIFDAVESGTSMQSVLDGDVVIYEMVGTARIEVEAG